MLRRTALTLACAAAFSIVGCKWVYVRTPLLHYCEGPACEDSCRLSIDTSYAGIPPLDTAACEWMSLRVPLEIVPNPYRRAAKIRYFLPTERQVRLAVYDARGRKVRVLLKESFQITGTHRVSWDGLNGRGAPVAPGVYVIRLDAGDGLVKSRKLILAR